jgi:phosphotriesterase-related protein
MSFARTVVGDVDPAALGVVLAHEHLIIDSPIVESRWPHIHLPSTTEAVAEVGQCLGVGIATMVDAMPFGCGGDPVRLAEISTVTGAHVIASTGLHTSKYLEGVEWALTGSVDDLSLRFTESIERGVDGARTGVLKVATAGRVPDAFERRLFEAGAATHLATGVPILTHCEEGEGGMPQIELLASLGISPERVALSHTDRVLDSAYHRDLMGTGANLCFDQGLRSPEKTAHLVAELTALGFGSQLLIGTDGARRSLWSTLGGSPGLAWIHDGFREALAARGVDDETLGRIFVGNPARWLTFSPGSASAQLPMGH